VFVTTVFVTTVRISTTVGGPVRAPAGRR